jgi:hypothetical protein
MSKLFTIILLLLSGCQSTTESYMGYAVYNQSFEVSGGETISLPVTSGGPIPAENSHYKIEVAGFVVGPSTNHENQSDITWNFALTSKNNIDISKVTVESVTPFFGVNNIKFEDNSPLLKNKLWLGSPEPVVINQETTPWLFSKGSSSFVFKITIADRNGSITVLHQPSIFKEKSKQYFLAMVRANNG